MDVELKPCPFCGNEAIFENCIAESFIRCKECPCSMAVEHQSDSDHHAINAVRRAWNKRA